ncbi:MAG: glycosyltransferase family 2 protein [Acidobacteriia bacterium]|nr:glycosyltransferase family 2 protein [Terriglobia bacterium]
MLVSVVVVNWNRCNLLRACLESIRHQTGVRLEVIVVDNGSEDGSLEMVLQEFSGYPGFNVRTISNSDNRGFCAANNQGIALAQGEWIALLNNDAEAEPDWLAQLLKVTLDRPETGMVACKILVHEDPTRIDKAGHLIYLDGQNRGRGTGQIDRGQFDRIEEVLWPDGCAALYRRSMLEEIGGFDEDFFAYADDAELGMRGRIAGWSCIYTPHAVVRHHRGSTLGLLSTHRLMLIERNRVLFAVKLFPWSLLWLNAPFYLARIAAGLWAAMKGKGEVTRFPGLSGKLRIAAALVRGNLQALPLLPRMLRKRGALKPLRRLSNRQIRTLLIENRISLKELMEQAN